MKKPKAFCKRTKQIKPTRNQLKEKCSPWASVHSHLACAKQAQVQEHLRQTDSWTSPPFPSQILAVQGTFGKKIYSVEKCLLPLQEVRPKATSTKSEFLAMHTFAFVDHACSMWAVNQGGNIAHLWNWLQFWLSAQTSWLLSWMVLLILQHPYCKQPEHFRWL